MRKPFLLAAFAGALLTLPTLALADEPATTKNGMLVDAQGMTLYAYDKDSAGKSACNGQCAANWPPLAAAAGAKGDGAWTVIKRDDGSAQWAYAGKPLYTFVQDKQAGDITGDGKMGVWHIAKP
ncbi:hypothetical protein NVV93_19580 [Pseudomonas sp. LS44]|uniref:COG4315 family predicted lipoprotein n=1 Tax=Pseudomonas sp. LS44 TaxID=1357074 RepID=UPI00215A95DA|nr:hypothetical protein [Pseudomonas sp. LS44]UVE17731.1 hypothetical protein NVV93_19580 [Pseudomonas sp. LS44]